MIKYAQFVIMHTSLAISFVLLFNKPVIFITTEQYDSYKNALASLDGHLGMEGRAILRNLMQDNEAN